MAALRIQLGRPSSSVYLPGQRLAGKVVYVAKGQQTLKDVTISFKGKIDTRFRENHNRHTESILLFHLSEQLFKGPFNVQPQTFEWEFDFLVPTHIRYDRAQGGLNQHVIVGGVSRTPPTFYHEHTQFDHSASAEIKYKLVAEAQVGGLFRDQSAQVPVSIRRVRDTPPPLITVSKHTIVPSPCWSNRDLGLRKHSLKERLQSTISNDPNLKSACIAFDTHVHMPHMLAVTQATPVGVSIQHKTITPNDPQNPILELVGLELAIRADTRLVVSRESLWGNIYSDYSELQQSHVLNFDPRPLPLDGEIVFVVDNMKLADWTGGLGKWPYIPNFRTYTVSLEHRMRVDILIRHAESKHVFKVRTEFPFAILDPYEPNVSGVEENRVYRSTYMSEVDPDLPAYEDDVAPPGMSDVHDSHPPIILQENSLVSAT